jgi:hypothetical protein
VSSCPVIYSRAILSSGGGGGEVMGITFYDPELWLVGVRENYGLDESDPRVSRVLEIMRRIPNQMPSDAEMEELKRLEQDIRNRK